MSVPRTTSSRALALLIGVSSLALGGFPAIAPAQEPAELLAKTAKLPVTIVVRTFKEQAISKDEQKALGSYIERQRVAGSTYDPVSLLKRLRSERERYRTDQFTTQLLTENTKLVVLATGVGFGPLGIATASLANKGIDSAVAQYSKVQAEAYRKKTSEIITVAIAQSSGTLKAEFDAAVARGDDKKLVQLRDRLFKDQQQFLMDGFLDQLPVEERQKAFEQATIHAAQLSHQLTGQEIDLLRKRIGTIKSDLNQLRENSEKFQAEMGQKLDGVIETQKALRGHLEFVSEQVQGLQTASEQNRQDILVLQKMMWDKLDTKEQLAALRDPGFLPGLGGDERQSAIDRLEKIDTAETVKGMIGVAGSAVAGLGRLKVLIPDLPFSEGDIANLQQNLATADAAVDVALNVMTGNWIGAIGAIGGLFPGGGVDPEQARHQQLLAEFEKLHAKLNEIIGLQKAILNRLDEVYVLIDQRSREIMARLDGIEYKLDFVTSGVFEPPFKRWGHCRTFRNQAVVDGYDAAADRFQSYDDRRHLFEKESLGIDFRECDPLLTNVSNLSGNGAPPLFLTASAQLEPSQRDFEWQVFIPQRERVARVLGLRAERPVCGRNVMALLAVAPDRFKDVALRSFTCPADADAVPIAEVLSRALGEPIGFAQGTRYALHPPAVLDLGRLLRFFGSFHELAVYNDDGQRQVQRLMTADELLQKPERLMANDVGITRLSRFRDVVDLAIATEALRTEVPILPWLADTLLSTNFGRTARDLDEPTRKLVDEMLMPEIPSPCKLPADRTADLNNLYQNHPYVVAECLIRSSELIRQNLLVFMLREEFALNNVHSAAYRVALQATSFVPMSLIRGRLAIEDHRAGEAKAWVLELKLHDGTFYDDLRLPSESEVFGGQILYPPSVYQLKQLRTELDDELALSELGRSIVPGSDAERTLLTDTALSLVAAAGGAKTQTQDMIP